MRSLEAMFRGQTIAFSALVMCIAINFLNCDAAAGESATPVISPEVSDAWSKTIGGYKKFSGTCVCSSTNAGEKKTFLTMRGKRDDGKSLLILEYPDLRHDAFVTNQKYSFHVRRKDENSPWLLLEVVLSPNAVFASRGQSVDDDCLSNFVPHCVAHRRLLPAALSTSVQVRAIDAVSPKRSKLTLAFSAEKAVDRDDPFTGGVAILDSENDWSICESKFEMKRRNQSFSNSSEFKLERGSSGQVFTKYIKTTASAGGGGPANQSFNETEYDIQFSPSIGQDDFTLTTFGIPEPPGYEQKKRTPAYVWYVLIGVGLLLLGLWLNLRSRRKA